MANEIGLTEVSATSQAVVANIVQMTLKQESIVLPTVSDWSRFAVPGAASVKAPRRNTFAAANKSENTNLTAQELTFSADTISLDKHKAIYAKLERIAGLQAVSDVQAEIIMEAAKELALQIDKDLIVELKLVSTSSPDHLLDYANTPTDTLAVADIVNARKLLNVQNVPMSDRYMLVSPAQEAALLQISDFIHADKYGSAEGVMNGELGRIFGFRVLMHSTLSDAQAIFYHKSHVGFAQQMQPEFRTNFDLASASDEFLLHTVYGCEALDGGRRAIFYNGSGS